MSMRSKLRDIVENNASKKGKIFDYCIQALIVLSLVSFTLETLPNNSVETKMLLKSFEYFCVIVFTIEYLLRIYVAKNPLKYIFSFYGLIDFIAIFPSYINTFYDFRALRAFRIFRVFRALKLVRYNKALNRFNLAAKIVREEVILFLLVTFIFIFLSSAGIYFFEHEAQPETFASILHSGWWAIVTLTTAGLWRCLPHNRWRKSFYVFYFINWRRYCNHTGRISCECFV